MDGQAEARSGGPRVTVMLVLRLPHRLQSLCQRERVAVVASCRDPVATSGWVPSDLCPLNARPCRHDLGVPPALLYVIPLIDSRRAKFLPVNLYLRIAV